MTDTKALGIVQGVISNTIFGGFQLCGQPINAASDILQQEFCGHKKAGTARLQGLRRDFEHTRMRNDESLSNYLARMFEIINQMKTCGEYLSNQRIFQNILIRLPRSCDSIAHIIEQTKDLETVDAHEAISTLKGYDQCLDMHDRNTKDVIEGTFADLSISAKEWKTCSQS